MIRPRSTLATSLLATVVGFAAACSDSTAPRGPLPPNGVVILNGSGQTGLTLAGNSGTATTHIAFNGSFDGAAVVVERDSALATSSALAGDLLWITDLRTGVVKSVQMPARSDPAGAAFLHGAGGLAYGVALRGLRALALVLPPAGAVQSVQIVPSAGRCPTDVFEHGGDIYVVDANADCTNFVADGVARLIRFTPDGVAHDTIGLAAGSVSTAAGAVVGGDFAYVATGGDADFSIGAGPAVFTRPGVVTKVNLVTKRVVGSVALPAGTYGAVLHLGADGRLYVTAYADPSFARQDVFAIDAGTLAFTGPRAAGQQRLDLRITDETGLSCSAATADALGRIYCVAVDYSSAGGTTLFVFGADGRVQRTLGVGQYGVDVALR